MAFVRNRPPIVSSAPRPSETRQRRARAVGCAPVAAIVVRKAFELGASPEKIWPLITDTDRFNRLFGLAPVAYRPIETTDSSARFVAETRTSGFKLVYDEYPRS